MAPRKSTTPTVRRLDIFIQRLTEKRLKQLDSHLKMCPNAVHDLSDACTQMVQQITLKAIQQKRNKMTLTMSNVNDSLHCLNPVMCEDSVDYAMQVVEHLPKPEPKPKTTL